MARCLKLFTFRIVPSSRTENYNWRADVFILLTKCKDSTTVFISQLIPYLCLENLIFSFVRHFHWMAEHGVDGAFLQRFAGQCDLESGNQGIMRIRDEVGERVREAAEREGRVFAIM